MRYVVLVLVKGSGWWNWFDTLADAETFASGWGEHGKAWVMEAETVKVYQGAPNA